MKLGSSITTLMISLLPVCYAQGVITTVAGTGTCCSDKDGVPATAAYLQGPDGMAVDSAGNIYIWETQPGVVRKVGTNGLITTAAGMASNRKRLGLSAADFALLVGTTGQSVYAWEAGKSKPRAEALRAIAALRHVGKREVEARLAELKG